MSWHILTGTPGAGKTAIVRQLEWAGYRVVEEAATDVIALEHALGRTEPESQDGFIGKILALQRRREQQTRDSHCDGDGIGQVIFDRSPVCTLALCRYLRIADSPVLTAAIDRLLTERAYCRTAFFVRNQGHVTPTAARRISFADSLTFEQVHERVYAELGFQLIDVPAGPLPARVELIRTSLAAGCQGANQFIGSSCTSAAPAETSAPTTSVRR